MKLIAKEKVISAIRQYEDWGCPATGSAISAVQEVAQIVGKIPTLTLDDLRPKGRWEEYEDGKFRCSVCKKKPLEIGYRTLFVPSFCYHCGADMRGGGEDE